MSQESGTLNPKNYFNRELSWIEFNRRVLAEAMNPDNPLLERLKFVGIVSANFDEFFMVRVAGLDGDKALSETVFEKSFEVMQTQHQYFLNELLPRLEKEGLRRLDPHNLDLKHKEYIKELFYKEILALVTPIAIHNKDSLAALGNLNLYRIFELVKQGESGTKHYAVVEVPKNYPRIITLPSDETFDYVLLGDIITCFAEELFHGYQIEGQGSLRITRRAEMSLDEEKDADFAEVMTEALQSRRLSPAIRLELNAPEAIKSFIKEQLDLQEHMIFESPTLVDLKSVSTLAFHPSFDALRLPKWAPCKQPEFNEAEDIWSLLSEKDQLLHVPYESFNSFVHFLNTAADDPDVLAIKQTLYRAGESSHVISALERAAEKGKQVTVLVELKARFDEERNIEWAKRLVHAGATVLYGVAGLKTHAKACLIVRREPDGIRRYAHLSTGNYNEKTAKIYSDLSLFTSNSALCADISSFFNVITGFSQPGVFAKIDVAPFGLRRKFERLILREAMRQKDQPGLIIAKMNSLVDTQIIDTLYRASQQGVKILLNIRGVCRLKPGIPGLSENIEVISVVDMFLEHSRIFYFQNGGNPELYLASADWMTRNLDRRLEIMFPIEDEKIKDEITDILKLYFKDNTNSWVLDAEGQYTRKTPQKNEKVFRVQDYLCAQAVKKEKQAEKNALKELRPQTPKRDLEQKIVQPEEDKGLEKPRQVRITPPPS